MRKCVPPLNSRTCLPKRTLTACSHGSTMNHHCNSVLKKSRMFWMMFIQASNLCRKDATDSSGSEAHLVLAPAPKSMTDSRAAIRQEHCHQLGHKPSALCAEAAARYRPQ